MIHMDYYGERSDGTRLYRTVSDKSVMIRKEGSEELFCEAIDIADSEYTYIETDIPVTDDSSITLEYALELLGVLGVEVDD